MKITPKFKTGDTVLLKRPTLYKETIGEITEVEKVYAETMNGGLFDEDGLHIRESDISNIKIPHEFKDDVLKITYDNNRTKTYTLFGYAYTIVTPKMCSIYPESALIKIEIKIEKK